MLDTVRWGIIGCGDVTEVKSGPALQKATRSELVAVMRRTGRLAADYAQRHGVARWYNDARHLIADPDVNAIYVATPPSTHQAYTLQALAAGKPVYVEKPMAMNHAECLAMLSAAEAADLPLFVAYYRRALAPFLKVKDLLARGTIGDVRYVTVNLAKPLRDGDLAPDNWRLDPATSGGGYFVDLAAHMLDLLDFLLGPIVAVTGRSTNQAGTYQAEDMVSGSFRFASGAHGVGTWCFSAFAEVDTTEIIGSRGKIRYQTFGDQPVLLISDKGQQQFAFTTPPHIQQPLIQTVVDALTGQGHCPSDGNSAARTSRVMDQLLIRPTR